MTDVRRSRLAAAVVILFVFCAGIAVGFFLHHEFPRHGFGGLGIGGPPPGPPPEVKRWMLERLDRDLDLTAGQHARIDTVLTRREADLRALMTETRPRFDSIAARTRSEIREVLTPAQQEKFAQLSHRFDEARRERRRGR